MKLQRWIRLLLVVSLLVSALSLTNPAQAPDLKTMKVTWCTATVTVPTPNRNGCTAAFDSLSDRLAALATLNPNKAGTTWLGKNYVDTTAGARVFDGASLSNMTAFPLTLEGGWSGLGTGRVNAGAPSSGLPLAGKLQSLQNQWVDCSDTLPLENKVASLAA